MPPSLRTPRLRLRPWRDGDADAFAAFSADAVAMALLLGPFDRAASDRWVAATGQSRPMLWVWYAGACALSMSAGFRFTMMDSLAMPSLVAVF